MFAYPGQALKGQVKKAHKTGLKSLKMAAVLAANTVKYY